MSRSAGTSRWQSARAYAGFAAYRLLRAPGATSATRIGGRRPTPTMRADVRREPAVGVHLRAVVAHQQR